jgi:hypothetical protein
MWRKKIVSESDRKIAHWKSQGMLGEQAFECESARAAEAQRQLEASVDKNAVDIGVGLSNEEIWGEGPWGRRPADRARDVSILPAS